MNVLHCLRALLVLSLVTGCALMPAEQGDVYELQRQAQTAYNGGDDSRAETLLLGLVRSVPNDSETWFYLGNLYARSNRPDEAAAAYQKVLMLNQRDPRAWHNLGVVRLRQAWAAFILAHDLFPLDSELHAKVEELIKAMEKMPLEGLQRTPKADASAKGDAKK